MATTADGGLTREQIRGSVLLLAGQVISTLVGSAVIQVLLVRHLSKTEYGAFAYALSVAILLEGFSSLGLSRAVARFIPIYDEEEDYRKLFGGLLLAIGATLGLGLAAVLLVNGMRGFIEGTLVNDTLAVTLLVILICLAPITALENVLDKTIVIFSSVRALFFRKYVLTPGLRLLVVLVLVVGDAGLRFLAFGYVAAGVIGLAAYGWILWRALHRRGLLQHFRLRGLTLPVREMLAFALPLLTTDLVFTVMTSSDAVMLGYFGDVEEVAALRAVVPFARLNQFVLLSFGLLFVPLASRLYARGDRAGINDLYWQSAAWVAVLSFPLFAVTSALASPLTILLFGERYADSAPLLAVLAVGYYFHAALGFNGMVLSVFKKVRYIVSINLLAAMVNIAANLVLIPAYGALGAALATSTALVVHNLLKQAGLLRLGTGVSLLPGRYVRVYLVLGVATTAVALAQLTVGPPLWLGLTLVGMASLAVLVATRATLDIAATFPELAGIRLLGALLGNTRSPKR